MRTFCSVTGYSYCKNNSVLSQKKWMQITSNSICLWLFSIYIVFE